MRTPSTDIKVMQLNVYTRILLVQEVKIMYTSHCDFQLYMYDYYAIHFIRAGCVVGCVQSLSIPQSTQQTQGMDASVGNSTTSEHLPTRHSERPLHVHV